MVRYRLYYNYFIIFIIFGGEGELALRCILDWGTTTRGVDLGNT